MAFTKKHAPCITTVLLVSVSLCLGSVGTTHALGQSDRQLVLENGLDDEDWEREDVEGLSEDLEMELAERELQAARIDHLAEVASDGVRTAAFIIEELTELVDPEVAVQTLRGSLTQTKNSAVQRIIRIKLVELHFEMDETEKAMNVVNQLISGEK